MAGKKKKVVEKEEFPKTLEEKMARFKTLARAQNKKAGETVIIFGSDMVYTTKTATGVPELDGLLGGGIPDGKIITVWGDKGSGKTTLALEYVARCQKKGLLCYYIALEKLDRERMEELGVDLDKLMIGQFPKAEMCLDSILQYAAAQTVDVIILDSIHSLSPEAEQVDKHGKAKDMNKENMALLARKLSEFFRRANHNLAKGKITLLLIGQTRIDLGGFVKLEKLTGGNALKHYSKLILHTRHGQGKNAPTEHQEDENGDGHTVKIGFECVVKIDKTQIAGTQMELSETRFPFYFRGGFHEQKAIVDAEPMIVGDCGVIEGEVIPELKQLANAEQVFDEEKPKKKRGRPAKKKED